MSENKNISYPLIDNQKENQYEFHIGEYIAKIVYIKTQNKILLTHTEVPKQLGGQGIGASLLEKVLEDIQKKDLTLEPVCSFVVAYIQKHPHWRKLVL